MIHWVDCTLDEDFVRSLQLMMKSVSECSCDEEFMEKEGPMDLKELHEHISSVAPHNINIYAFLNKKERLGFDDFIKIYWDTRHIAGLPMTNPEKFGDVLNPIRVKKVDDDGCSGVYKGKPEIQVRGLYDPTGKVKKGDIVLAHFAMIVGTVDKDQGQKIIDHQSKDEELIRVYRDLTYIDYTGSDNQFQQTKDAYQKYRH